MKRGIFFRIHFSDLPKGAHPLFSYCKPRDDTSGTVPLKLHLVHVLKTKESSLRGHWENITYKVKKYFDLYSVKIK